MSLLASFLSAASFPRQVPTSGAVPVIGREDCAGNAELALLDSRHEEA